MVTLAYLFFILAIIGAVAYGAARLISPTGLFLLLLLHTCVVTTWPMVYAWLGITEVVYTTIKYMYLRTRVRKLQKELRSMID